jgi:short-subunit dehydrogenase involved in D-alanine esterification of teichoic acids
VSSGLAIVPKQTASIYCASKAALHSFSKTLRWQLEGTAVKVFEVLPSVVDTAMTAGRGRAKISPDRLAEEFLRGFQRDQLEMRIGLVKVFAVLHRLAPSVVERLIRSGQ